MTKRVGVGAAALQVDAGAAPVTAGSAVEREAFHHIVRWLGVGQEFEVMLDDVQPFDDSGEPYIHLVIGEHNRKSLQNKFRFLRLLKTHTVDYDSRDFVRWDQAVEDMVVGATLNSHSMFVVVVVPDVVGTLGFVLQGAVLSGATFAKHSVHFEGDLVSIVQSYGAPELGLVDFVVQYVGGILGEILVDEHIEESSRGFRGVELVSLRREYVAVLSIEDVQGLYDRIH